MQGWRMILLVNGGLFLFMAASAWAVSGMEGAPGGPLRNVAFGLLAVGIFLILLGMFLKPPPRRPTATVNAEATPA